MLEGIKLAKDPGSGSVRRSAMGEKIHLVHLSFWCMELSYEAATLTPYFNDKH